MDSLSLVVPPFWQHLPVMENFCEIFLGSKGSQIHNVLKTQDAVRKSVERVFQVLFRRIKLLYVACEFWNIEKMLKIATVAVALHNMIVEDERSGYVSHGTSGRSQNFTECDDADIRFISLQSGEIPVSTRDSVFVSDDIKVCAKKNLPPAHS